jgi:plastocyanin
MSWLACPSAVQGAELRGRVVDADGAGVPEAVVFVAEPPPGATPAADQHTATMDQVKKEFVPHILAVPVGTQVSFPNHDQIHHHVYSFTRTKTFEIPLYKGETAPPVLFDKPGAVKVGCNIHDWMSAVILVVPTAYFAVTDQDGSFVIHDLPDGPTVVTAWHERSKVKPEEAQQRIDVGEENAPLRFTLPLAPPRVRPRADGMRQYE